MARCTGSHGIRIRIDIFLVCSRIISKRIRSCCILCTLSFNKPTSAFQERLSSESCSSHPEIHKAAEGLALPAGTSCGVMSNEDTRAWEGLWTTRGLFPPRTNSGAEEGIGAASFLSMISASGRGTLLPPRQTTQQNPDDEDFQNPWSREVNTRSLCAALLDFWHRLRRRCPERFVTATWHHRKACVAWMSFFPVRAPSNVFSFVVSARFFFQVFTEN